MADHVVTHSDPADVGAELDAIERVAAILDLSVENVADAIASAGHSLTKLDGGVLASDVYYFKREELSFA